MQKDEILEYCSYLFRGWNSYVLHPTVAAWDAQAAGRRRRQWRREEGRGEGDLVPSCLRSKRERKGRREERDSFSSTWPLVSVRPSAANPTDI